MKTNNLVRTLLMTSVLMLIPLLGSQVLEGWAWSAFDYVAAAVMFLVASLVFEFGRSMGGNYLYKMGFGLALFTGFVILWGNLAVGFIGSEDNSANLMYGAVLMIMFFGSIMSRFQARGMSYTMYAAAVAMALVPVIAYLMNSTFQEIPEAADTVQIFALNAIFVALLAGSGLLFKQSTHPAELANG